VESEKPANEPWNTSLRYISCSPHTLNSLCIMTAWYQGTFDLRFHVSYALLTEYQLDSLAICLISCTSRRLNYASDPCDLPALCPELDSYTSLTSHFHPQSHMKSSRYSDCRILMHRDVQQSFGLFCLLAPMIGSYDKSLEPFVMAPLAFLVRT
jgi:hypothetical protein